MSDTQVLQNLGCPSGLAPLENQGGDLNVDAFVRQSKGLNHLELDVRGAKCGGCISKIESAAKALPGVSLARLNLSTGRMRLEWSGELTGSEITQSIAGLGYGVSARSPNSESDARMSEERSLLIAMGVAGFAAANIMLLSISVWGGVGEMGGGTRQAFHAISGLIALPVIIFSGHHFYVSAWRALRHQHVNMDVPITLAIWLAFFVSVWETIIGGPHAYFDACVMLLFFLLVGRFLDARLRRQAYGAAHDLAILRDKTVTRIDPASGNAISVRADEIVEGDEVLLASGERAVVDMKITNGTSEVDESLVSGESMPRLVAAGTLLYAGTVNVGDPLKGVAVSPASNSLLADISNMLETGEQRRSNYRKIADRAVQFYVPFVHSTAALTLLVWLILGASVREAVLVAVSTLIITCPCALALAAPVVQVVATGRLFRSGVFLKSGDALERFADIDHIVFDKTGTLTLGVPTLIASTVNQAALVDAAKLPRRSRHPLSRAIVAAAGPGSPAVGITEHIGLGLEADIDGVACRLGSAEWVGVSQRDSSFGPELWFSRGVDSPVCFRFEEQLRDDTITTIQALQDQGLSMEILSGDQPIAVSRMAAALGISHWTSRARPREKSDRLEALRSEGKKVLMVGDGLNDAGAIAMAHASLTPGGAMDVSQSASDAVYTGSPRSILEVLRVSRSAKQVMLENFGLAAAYNLVAVPIAVTGNVTPLIAAIAMSASSLIVTLNALRLGRNWKLGL